MVGRVHELDNNYNDYILESYALTLNLVVAIFHELTSNLIIICQN